MLNNHFIETQFIEGEFDYIVLNTPNYVVLKTYEGLLLATVANGDFQTFELQVDAIDYEDFDENLFMLGQQGWELRPAYLDRMLEKNGLQQLPTAQPESFLHIADKNQFELSEFQRSYFAYNARVLRSVEEPVALNAVDEIDLIYFLAGQNRYDILEEMVKQKRLA